MSDEDRGPILFRPQTQQLFVETIAGHLVEGAERLVHQQQARGGGKGAGNGNAHLHSSRELPRVGARHVGEAYQLQQGVHFSFADFAGDALQLQAQADIAGYGSPGQQGRVLKDVGDGLSRLTGVMPSTRMAPEVALVRPEMSLSKVDLPQPEGPIRLTNSPLAMVRSICCSTVVLP